MPARSFTDDNATAFRADVRAWLAEVVPDSWATADRTDPAEELARRGQWDRLVSDGGYAGLSWPTEWGGRGLGVIEEFVFAEEAARVHAPDVLNFIGVDLAGPAIIAYGTEEQKAHYLPRILRQEDLWCEGFSEPDAGSDLAGVRTTAVSSDDGYVVNGQKTWTSVADRSDRCYLLARTAEGPRRHNLSVLLVDMHQSGIECRPIRQITDGSEFSEVFFTDVHVDRGDLLGTENDGWRLATLAGFRQERRVSDALRRYVLIRRSIDQLVSCWHELGSPVDETLVSEVELVRWHARRCAELRAAGRDMSRPAGVLRIVWSELWQRIAERGLALACPHHRDYWRDILLRTRSATIAGGTAQIQRNIVAGRLLGMPR